MVCATLRGKQQLSLSYNTLRAAHYTYHIQRTTYVTTFVLMNNLDLKHDTLYTELSTCVCAICDNVTICALKGLSQILFLCCVQFRLNKMCTARYTLQKGKFCVEPCIGGFLPSSTYVQGIPCLAGANTSTPAQSDPCIFAHTGNAPLQYPSTILCLTRIITLVDLVKN